jgi:hypothetical protein
MPLHNSSFLVSWWADNPQYGSIFTAIVDEPVRTAGIEIEAVSSIKRVGLVLDKEIELAGKDISKFLASGMRVKAVAADIGRKNLQERLHILAVEVLRQE